MSGYEITCINKNLHGALVRIGGVNWSLGIHEAIVQIVSQQIRLFVYFDGQAVEIGVRGDGPAAYLALEPDGAPLQDLATLPSC